MSPKDASDIITHVDFFKQISEEAALRFVTSTKRGGPKYDGEEPPLLDEPEELEEEDEELRERGAPAVLPEQALRRFLAL